MPLQRTLIEMRKKTITISEKFHFKLRNNMKCNTKVLFLLKIWNNRLRKDQMKLRPSNLIFIIILSVTLLTGSGDIIELKADTLFNIFYSAAV